MHGHCIAGLIHQAPSTESARFRLIDWAFRMFPLVPPHRPLYRVFHLTRDGSIFSADVVDAGDDADAIEQLKAMAQDHPLELWDRARFVAKAEPPIGAMIREMVVTTARTEAVTAIPSEDGAGAEGPASEFRH